MPLSRPKSRNQIHTREVRCYGYERDDGLWDIEGCIIDRKTYSFDNFERGTVASGEPVHEMWVRLTIDRDFVVQDAEASTEASPMAVCCDVAPAVSALKGLRIGSGWTNAVRERIGRTKGCTHINQLIVGPLATTAIQTLFRERSEEEESPRSRPAVVDTCYALASDGEAVKRRWPEYYTGD